MAPLAPAARAIPEARRRDAATVKRVSSRARRQLRGVGDGSSHGFGARSGRTLLGFGNALIIARPLPVGLGRSERWEARRARYRLGYIARIRCFCDGL